ncbi:MAG: pyrroline-5-carboxylate reductase [Nitrospiraceae bacterium]|nr:pyrroline-5-carboxylate reductase [Nitrospiraceae bacterium]
MIGFIGGGNMAEAMIKGMTAKGMKDIYVSEPREDRRHELAATYGVKATSSNHKVVSSCDVIILAVKPQNMGKVLDEIAPGITEETLVISIAAGITLAYLESRLKTRQLIRVMPNTPALVQEGMSVMSLCGSFHGSGVDTVQAILMSIGRVLVLPEELMDAVTAVSGSGPAFFALFVEAMIGAGERMGLSGKDATALALQTMLGTVKLLETGMSAEKLRRMVTSPGGTTEAGLKVFEERSLRDIVSDALLAARKRAAELGRRE